MPAGMAEFIERRRPSWERLSGIVGRAGVRGGRLRDLSRDDLKSLGPLYRRAASDLALVRLRGGDVALIQYLNDLVIRSHGLLYIDADAPGWGRLLRVYRHRLSPFTSRPSGVYVLLALAAIFSERRPFRVGHGRRSSRRPSALSSPNSSPTTTSIMQERAKQSAL